MAKFREIVVPHARMNDRSLINTRVLINGAHEAILRGIATLNKCVTRCT